LNLPQGFKPFDGDEECSEADRERWDANQRRVFERVIREAYEGTQLDSDKVAVWHREMLEGLSYVPAECYLGGYRGSRHPWLKDYDVGVGGAEGIRADQVAMELERFFSELTRQIQALAIAVPSELPKTPNQLRRVAELAGWAHGEWVRLHPFANGNGRIARLLANFILARFRLPPRVQLRPRPDLPYEALARESMTGEHRRTIEWVLSLMEDTD
jgi:hypothetical protein